jgi:hypothetical protein
MVFARVADARSNEPATPVDEHSAGRSVLRS